MWNNILLEEDNCYFKKNDFYSSIEIPTAIDYCNESKV